MNRFPLAACLPLLLATAVAQAEIVVEDRALARPAAAARPTPAPAPAVRTLAGSPAPAASTAAPAATPAAAPAAGGEWEQYTQVAELQKQIQQLQGLMEQQGFLIEKLQNDLRVRYADLDQRLNAQQEQLKQQASAAAAATSGATPAAAPGTPATASATLEDEKRAYLAAYDTFRSGGPDKAIPPMLAFVKRYPNSTFVPSAYYWLGEFYLNAKAPDTAAAQKQFDIVLSNYPDSPKAAAALYKTGAILDLAGKSEEAGKRMQELLQKYPKSPEAALAQSYLDALEQARAPAEPETKPAAKTGSGKDEPAKPTASKAKKSTQTTSRKKN